VTKLLAGCRTTPAEDFSIFWMRRSWLEQGIGRELVEREVEQPAVQRTFFVIFLGTVGWAERVWWKDSEDAPGHTYVADQWPTTHSTAQVTQSSPRNVFSGVLKCGIIVGCALSLGRINPTGEVPLWFCAFTLRRGFIAETKGCLSVANTHLLMAEIEMPRCGLRLGLRHFCRAVRTSCRQ